MLCLDDFSRVKLLEIPGEEGSDYINASFLDVSCRMIIFIGNYLLLLFD